MKTTSIQSIVNAVLQRKYPFLIVFAAVFFVTYLILFIIDFIPEPPAEESTVPALTEPIDAPADTIEVEESVPAVPAIRQEANVTPRPSGTVLPGDASALPVSLIIDSLNRTVPVLNPTSRAIADLDAALLSGTVRHPDSATFTNEGNIFILGHSSYLPNVLNRNYQALNGIQTLKWGDTIRLRSADAEYVYQVEKVYEAKASEVTVPIANTGPRLTLATCDSFGSTDDRFIVEAKLIETRAL